MVAGDPSPDGKGSLVIKRGIEVGHIFRRCRRLPDLRNVVAGDPSPDGKGSLVIKRGIEVGGHIFQLGTTAKR